MRDWWFVPCLYDYDSISSTYLKNWHWAYLGLSIRKTTENFICTFFTFRLREGATTCKSKVAIFYIENCCIPTLLIERIMRSRYMGVYENRGTPKWMVCNGKTYWNGWFGGTPIFGNTHIPSREKKSHLGRRKIIFKSAWVGDLLVLRRIIAHKTRYHYFFGRLNCKCK